MTRIDTAQVIEAVEMTAEERKQLEEVLRRADEFERREEIDLMRQPLEGQLMKFTNAFQGWQSRWFVLDPRNGELRYYLKEEHKQQSRLRGKLPLIGAVISPSEDDSMAFQITPVTGDGFKLKASDTKQRQQWVNRLRTVAEDQRARRTETPTSRDERRVLRATETVAELPESLRADGAKDPTVAQQLHRVLVASADQQQAIQRSIQALDADAAVDRHVLLLKMTSKGLLESLSECEQLLGELTDASVAADGKGKRAATVPRRPSIDSIRARAAKKHAKRQGNKMTTIGSAMGESAFFVGQNAIAPAVFPGSEIDEEVRDAEAISGFDVTTLETPRLLSTLSRLKLGVDLSSVAFPAVALQPRSLLELYSDCFANGELLLKLPTIECRLERMLQVVKWYVSSLWCACKNGFVRKPYNPLLGEIFQCRWQCSDVGSFRFVAEQPPISAFSAVSAEHNVHVSACVSPRSKYVGMAATAALDGVGQIAIVPKGRRYNEIYTFTFPSAHIRSILTNPWFEFGGKVELKCARSETAATITFNAKPFYGGKAHRIQAEIRDAENDAIHCRLQGEWNSGVQITYADESNLPFDVSRQRSAVRFIQPTERQTSRESRVIWQQMTSALRKGDFETADARKRQMELTQREKLQRLRQQQQRDSDYYVSRHFVTADTDDKGKANVGWTARDFPT